MLKKYWEHLALVTTYGIWVAYSSFRYIFHNNDVMPMESFNPMVIVNSMLHPELYTRSLNPGFKAVGWSVIFLVYKWIERFFGIPTDAQVSAVIFLEVLTLSLSAIFFFRTLFPKSSAWVALLFGIWLCSSTAREINFSNFFGNNFIGQYYIFSDALIFLAASMCLRRKFFVSGLLIGLCFLFHPTKAVFAGIFISGFLLFDPEFRRRINPWLGLSSALILALPWMWNNLKTTQASTELMKPDVWLFVMGRTSYHWMQFQQGFMGPIHYHRFLPFLSYSLILVSYVKRYPRLWDKRLTGGFLAVAALVALGIAASVFPNPTLIKMGFHRSLDFFILCSLPAMLQAFYLDITEQPIWRSLLPVLVLVLAFSTTATFSAALALFIGIELFFVSGSSKDEIGFFVRFSREFYLLICLLLAYYFWKGWMDPWNRGVYTGHLELAKIISNQIPLFIIFLFVFSVSFAKKYLRNLRIISVVVLCAFLSREYFNSIEFVLPAKIISADTKQAQLWARDNTNVDSLFMSDPAFSSGWEGYSQRSHFGGTFQWLYSALANTSSQKAFEDGKSILRDLEIDVDQYLKENTMGFMNTRLSQMYNSFDDSKRNFLKQKYGIDYFIYLKPFKNFKTSFPIAFENDSLVILKSATNSIDRLAK